MSKKSKKVNQAVSSSIPREMDFSYFAPIEVKVFNNFEKAFKIFRTLVQSERILSLFKEKQSYEKPSIKRRRKKNEAMKRTAEAEMKMEKIRSGEYDKEKAKKQLKKEKKRKEFEEKSKETVK